MEGYIPIYRPPDRKDTPPHETVRDLFRRLREIVMSFDPLERRVKLLEERLDYVDGRRIRELRRYGMTWDQIHRDYFPHLSMYKIKQLHQKRAGESG